jgi:hypothetical protein
VSRIEVLAIENIASNHIHDPAAAAANSRMSKGVCLAKNFQVILPASPYAKIIA